MNQVEYILTRKVMSRKAWRLFVSQRTTRFLESGSIFHWSGDELFNDALDPPWGIERFLIKWVGKSYLHVSWELKEDILEPSIVAQAPSGKYGPQKLLDDFMFCSTRPYVYHDDVDSFRTGNAEEYFSPERLMIVRIIGLIQGKEQDEHEECIPVLDLHSDNCKVLIEWRGEKPPLDHSEDYELVKDLQTQGIDYERALRRFLRTGGQSFSSSHPQLVFEQNFSERLQALSQDEFLKRFFRKLRAQPYLAIPPHIVKKRASTWLRP